MRLQISFVVAFTLLILLLVSVAEPANARRSLVEIDGQASTNDQLLGVSQLISLTITPTNTGSTTMPTVTVAPTSTAVVSNSERIVYLPALIDASSASGLGEPAEPCGPTSIVSPTIRAEPTSTPIPTSVPDGGSDFNASVIVSDTVCPPNIHELTLATLIIESPLQQRSVMTYNPILAQVAKNHAMDMAVRQFFGPQDPNGIGPNRRATTAGYQLPDYYDLNDSANNIETTMAGYTTAEGVWRAFLNNSGSEHVWGRNDGYREQSEYGIGYAYIEDSPHKRYWVILIAKPFDPAEATPTKTPGPTSTPTSTPIPSP